MPSVQIRNCSIQFQCSLQTSVPFDEQDFGTIAKGILSKFNWCGVKASDIALDRGDQLFSYSLKASFLEGLVELTLNSGAASAQFKSVVRTEERALVLRLLQTWCAVLGDFKPEAVNLTVMAHASCDPPETRDAYLRSNAKPEAGIAEVGALAYRLEGKYAKALRLEVDKSFVYPDALFLNWLASDVTIGQLLAERTIWDELFDVAQALNVTIVSNE